MFTLASLGLSRGDWICRCSDVLGRGPCAARTRSARSNIERSDRNAFAYPCLARLPSDNATWQLRKPCQAVRASLLGTMRRITGNQVHRKSTATLRHINKQ
eukprot:6923124-Pyramimonas_sp.AAC.1